MGEVRAEDPHPTLRKFWGEGRGDKSLDNPARREEPVPYSTDILRKWLKSGVFDFFFSWLHKFVSAGNFTFPSFLSKILSFFHLLLNGVIPQRLVT